MGITLHTNKAILPRQEAIAPVVSGTCVPARRAAPPSAAPSPATKDERARLLTELRHTLHRLEGIDRCAVSTVSTGSPVLDAALPWDGLPTACLHDIQSATPEPLALMGGAATGFAASLAARLAGNTGTVLWCRRGVPPHAPGLVPFGIDPDRLVLVQAHDDQDILWAMEEGLRDGGPAVVLGEVASLSLTAARRLQLAAETGQGTGLLLRARPTSTASPGTAMTRWRIGSDPLPAPGTIRSRWRLELLHCRHRSVSEQDQWHMEWIDEAGGFRVVANLCHRPAATTLAPNRAEIIPLRQTG